MESKRDLTDCGVIYVATNDIYVRSAILSAESAKKHCGPELKIHIYTDDVDKCKASGFFDSVERIENPHRRSKVDYMGLTPFKKTLFLDADTRVVADFTDVFFLLEKYDVAMVHAMRRAHKNPRFWNIQLPYSFPQLNSGVFLYRKNDKVLEFLAKWKEAFHTAGIGKDQVTLRELLWLSDLNIYVLPPEYNVRYQKFVDIWAACQQQNEAVPKILHMRKFITELQEQQK